MLPGGSGLALLSLVQGVPILSLFLLDVLLIDRFEHVFLELLEGIHRQLVPVVLVCQLVDETVPHYLVEVSAFLFDQLLLELAHLFSEELVLLVLLLSSSLLVFSVLLES